MADHYRVLGVTRNATKEEIKEAFRGLAIKFHPDKHAQSSRSARDAATLKFKQVSDAYEVLIDDRKRAAYNLSRQSYNNGGNFYSAGSGSYGYNNANYNGSYYYSGGGSYCKNSTQRWASSLDAALRYMTTREFLRNFVFASLLLAGTVAIEMSGDALWKMHNTGLLFESDVPLLGVVAVVLTVELFSNLAIFLVGRNRLKTRWSPSRRVKRIETRNSVD